MAGAARTAAARLIRPRVEAGQRVWFAGHWGFHWYAEEAGAMVLSVDPPFPRRGDIVVSSSVDRPVGPAARSSAYPDRVLGKLGTVGAGDEPAGERGLLLGPVGSAAVVVGAA